MDTIKVLLFLTLIVLGIGSAGIGLWFGRLALLPVGKTVNRKVFVFRTLLIAMALIFAGAFAIIDGLSRLSAL
ncbi:hypothetical protein [Ferrimonas kyonanensis]|uniref:hypothetical protein n=1 Tax=Ferrimonas kyonanensis TaxID=364763 RepID=UPI0012EC85E5|nr:hypothetical protein [Ferrimonas kyonanensis]